MTGEGLRTMLSQLFGNTFLALSGGAALVFLFRRQFVRFLEFAVLAVMVATFIFTPEMWVSVAKGVAQVIGGEA